MKDVIFKEVIYASQDYDKTLALRDLVLRKPLNLEFSLEELGKEKSMWHLAFFRGEECIACLVLLGQEKGKIKMRQVVVDAQFQSKGIGRELILHAESFAKEKGFKWIHCNARETAVGFYEKLAYEKQGKPFTEIGIPHIKMAKALV